MFEILNPHQLSDRLQQQSRTYLDQFFARQDIGFVTLPDRVELWEESKKWGRELRQKFSSLVIVGIGGSSLGARALVQVVGATNVHFVDNVDGVEFDRLLSRLGDLNQVGWLFISKSGTTIETLLALEFIAQKYAHKNLFVEKNAIVITEKKDNTLSRWAHENKVPQAEVPIDVGGRFSVLSPVGLIPAVYMGMDIDTMRAGALGARNNRVLIETMMAHFMWSFEGEKWVTMFWYYTSRAHALGMWLNQLWAESLGKKVDRKGRPAPRASTPMWAIGAIDQHSVLQQVMEGASDKFVVFHRFDDAEGGELKLRHSQFAETKCLQGKTMGALLKAEAIATEEALRGSGVPTLCIKTKVLNEHSLGYYFMLFELVIAGLGEWMDIDAFNQPGVELGKRLAKDLLQKA